MRLMLILALCPGMAAAESVIALRTIPAQSVVTEADLDHVDAVIPGAVTDVALVVGQEARVTIYAGRPIKADDFGAPTLADRNQIVPLIYAAGGLQITTEGRALGRGGTGDVIRVMNLASRNTVSGVVTDTGAVRVGPLP
jgi:flagellar basal body P-ring formation protein FlgA